MCSDSEGAELRARSTRMRWTWAIAVLLGCARSGEPPEEGGLARARDTETHEEAPVDAAETALGALPEAQGTGSTVVVADVGDRRIVLVADADDRSVVAVDTIARREVARTPLRARPAQMVVGDDGWLYVALRDGGAVAVLEASARGDGALEKRGEIPTAAEPVGLATRGDELLVVSGWGRRLESFSLATRRRRLDVSLGREPRAVTFARDGNTAFVAHMVGATASAVDLERGEARAIPLRGGDLAPPRYECDPDGTVHTIVQETPRSTVQGFSVVAIDDRVFFPAALVRPGNPSERTDGYGRLVADLPSHILDVAVVNAPGEKPLPPSVHVQMESAKRRVGRYGSCILPRGAAVDEERGSLFVACLDGQVVMELDAGAPDPARAEKRRFLVGEGTTGVAIASREREAYAFSQFGEELSVLVLGDPKAKPGDRGGHYKTIRVPLSADREDRDARFELGRALFHRSDDRRIARDGRACASCHPDGRDDGLVWPTPEGPRQPPLLAGRLAGTAPYSWTNGHATLEDHLARTIKNLGGKGLDEGSTAALVAYLGAMPPPPRGTPPDDARARRGHALFTDPAIGCAQCHHESTAWMDGSMHDVSSAGAGDRGVKFDTPSLRFVGGTAPYFHDGRYATLRELLRSVDGTMGSTGQLGEEDLAALEAYVETL